VAQAAANPFSQMAGPFFRIVLSWTKLESAEISGLQGNLQIQHGWMSVVTSRAVGGGKESEETSAASRAERIAIRDNRIDILFFSDARVDIPFFLG